MSQQVQLNCYKKIPQKMEEQLIYLLTPVIIPLT